MCYQHSTDPNLKNVSWMYFDWLTDCSIRLKKIALQQFFACYFVSVLAIWLTFVKACQSGEASFCGFFVFAKAIANVRSKPRKTMTSQKRNVAEKVNKRKAIRKEQVERQASEWRNSSDPLLQSCFTCCQTLWNRRLG